MRERFPYFSFWPADFVNDIHVLSMSPEQIGCYVLLLCRAWQASPPGTLPNNDTILAKLACVNAETWAKIKDGVLAPFKIDDEGRLYSKRLIEEYEVAEGRSRKATAAINKRWHGGNTTVTAPVIASDQNRSEQNRTEIAEEEKHSSCSEPSGATASEPAAITFPTTGKSKEWGLTSAKLAEYRDTFPGLDVLGELRKARQWVKDNPTKRKTANGMGRFLYAWLERSQNSGRGVKAEPSPARVRSQDDRYGNIPSQRSAGITAEEADAQRAAAGLPPIDRGGCPF